MFKNISGGKKNKKNLSLMQISAKFIQSQDKLRGKVPHSPSPHLQGEPGASFLMVPFFR